MARATALLLLAATFACAGPRGPHPDTVTIPPPRSETEAEQRLRFVEERLDKNRLHAQLWHWSWLGIDTFGVTESTISAIDEDDNGDRAADIIDAAQSLVGILDVLVFRPLPGRHGAGPLRDLAENGASVETRLAEGERILRAAAKRAHSKWDWKTHAGTVAFQAFGAGILLALGEEDNALQSFGFGMVGGEANIWSEPDRPRRDFDEYVRMIQTDGLPSEPSTSWRLAPIPHGLALQIRY
jgi:hypothetical protein